MVSISSSSSSVRRRPKNRIFHSTALGYMATAESACPVRYGFGGIAAEDCRVHVAEKPRRRWTKKIATGSCFRPLSFRLFVVVVLFAAAVVVVVGFVRSRRRRFVFVVQTRVVVVSTRDGLAIVIIDKPGRGDETRRRLWWWWSLVNARYSHDDWPTPVVRPAVREITRRRRRHLVRPSQLHDVRRDATPSPPRRPRPFHRRTDVTRVYATSPDCVVVAVVNSTLHRCCCHRRRSTTRRGSVNHFAEIYGGDGDVFFPLHVDAAAEWSTGATPPRVHEKN